MLIKTCPTSSVASFERLGKHVSERWIAAKLWASRRRRYSSASNSSGMLGPSGLGWEIS
jgi:hypothetical protein